MHLMLPSSIYYSDDRRLLNVVSLVLMEMSAIIVSKSSLLVLLLLHFGVLLSPSYVWSLSVRIIILIMCLLLLYQIPFYTCFCCPHILCNLLC